MKNIFLLLTIIFISLAVNAQKPRYHCHGLKLGTYNIRTKSYNFVGSMIPTDFDVMFKDNQITFNNMSGEYYVLGNIIPNSSYMKWNAKRYDNIHGEPDVCQISFGKYPRDSNNYELRVEDETSNVDVKQVTALCLD